METGKSQGIYTIEKMKQMATVAQTADGLEINGNNFKINALCGCPDMVLFACEQMEEQAKSYNAAIDYALADTQGRIFLEYWGEGAWPEIARDFPEFDLTTTGQCDKDGNLLAEEKK